MSRGMGMGMAAPAGAFAVSPPLERMAVADVSGVAAARRRAAALATRLGHDEADAGRVALAATELASNLVKHAGGGELLLGPAEPTSPPGTLRLIAIDHGPGMPNIAACLRDGFSTAGSAGQGLGALQRLAWRLEIESWPGRGTTVLAVLGPRRQQGAAAALAPPPWGGVTLPMPGQTASGDACAAALSADGQVLSLALADGLGHGEQAASAAAAALGAFAARPFAAPCDIVAAMDDASRSTRGAAVGIARLGEPTPRHVRFAGLGNVAALAVGAGGGVRRLASVAGIAGHGANARRLREHAIELPDGATVLLHSDGISASGWPARDDPWPLLPRLHPVVAAALICRDHARHTDDAAVLIGRIAAA